MSHQPENISAGTQVVALVEIRGPNKSLVHPRGAVGVVTRTPAGKEDHFDRRGIYLAPAELRWSLFGAPEQFEDNATQACYWGLQRPVKTGSLPWPEVDAWRRELHHDFERALAETKLPERPDYETANKFLIRARRQTVK